MTQPLEWIEPVSPAGTVLGCCSNLYANPLVELLIGDATKAREQLGWTPTVSFADLVAMMVEADIAAAKAGW